MSYQISYNATKACRCHFLLNELISLCNTIPDTRSRHGRRVEFPLPVLFVLLGLKFDLGLSYRDFVAYVNFNPPLLERLDLERAPSHALLHAALNRIDSKFDCRIQQWESLETNSLDEAAYEAGVATDEGAAVVDAYAKAEDEETGGEQEGGTE